MMGGIVTTHPIDNSLDKRKAKVYICNFSHIRHLFEQYHYKGGHMGGGIHTCFAMFIDSELVGGSVLGAPRHTSKYKNFIDIRRMACTDLAPYNSESWFLSQIIKWITANTEFNGVLSYSDMTVGHIGTIYKAANFELIGETAPTKYVEWNGKTYHPRSLSIDRDYSYKLRDAVKSGTAIIRVGKPKRVWSYSIVRDVKRGNRYFSLPTLNGTHYAKHQNKFF
jgi:hypothetical protein